ncbi:unnamed protein product, partial [Mesorhabditis belari]|uniref:Uncharacterized protein n=1 Tax=Mesorhabditis belari TaxID=2138241 RepID=A0AAF3J2N2_9BILA
MYFYRYVLLGATVINLIIFLTGLFLGIFFSELLLLSLFLTSFGLLGMILLSVCWFIKPKFFVGRLLLKEKQKEESFCIESKIDQEVTEDLMRNIRGIPFLIQAIQYSMETSYFRDMMGEIGEGIVQTSVIHTAPACTSMLDSGSTTRNTVTPRSSLQNHRHSAEEQWLENGENNWRNEQLRLSLQQSSSNIIVFPLCEASPQRNSIEPPIEHDFSRIESIRRNHGPKPKTANNQFQVRCIGMSAAFIERFNTAMQTSTDA